MSLGRISGPLLKSNLLRNGINLAFETDLLYLDVTTGRVGIKTQSPSNELQVVGTTRTTNLITDTQAEIASFTINNNVIASSNSIINLEPSGTNPVIYQGKIVTGSLQLSTNLIETTGINTDLIFQPSGTGVVNVNSNMFVDGDLHATGNITADGDITIGDGSDDNVIFNADVASDIIPDTTNTYDIGTDQQSWKTIYSQNLYAENITASQAEINGIDLTLTQGNIYYVSTNGSNTNLGLHDHDPVATVKYALSLASTGDTIFIFPGTYTELFPLTVPQGVAVRGAGIRAVSIKPTTETRYNDAFLLNGETTIEDLSVVDFFSGGNYFTVVSATEGAVTFNAGVAPFAHTYVSGGSITVNGTNYSVTNATYNNVTGETTVTHTGGIAVDNIFLSNLTFSCNGGTRVFPNNGYAFRFATDFTVTTRSPYVRNCSVITKGSITSINDPLGFDSSDAGKGAYIDGAYATSLSKEASMLFHSVTFITPNVDAITATNGSRIEWLNSFTYYGNRGIYAFSSNDGLAGQGETRLRINTRTGSWNVGNTLSYYDTDGTTILASGVISSIDGNYVNLIGKQSGFETITDRIGKTVYPQGSAKLSTAQQKFGTASLSLTGPNDYATIASNPDFNFGVDDFTVEFWIYRSNSAAIEGLLDFRTISNQAAGFIYANGSSLYYYVSGANRISAASALPNSNTWYHIVYSRFGTDGKLFVNGAQVGSTWIDNTDYVQSPLTIGSNFTHDAGVTGYLDEIRISKGVAKYTSNFIEPTSQLTGDLNTVLLLHLNGPNNSLIITDEGITYQDLRTSDGGTAQLINFADYSDFGVEIRSIGSACVYGNYGVYGTGEGVIAYLISQNFAYVGSGKISTNDPNDRIDANEVVELNRAKIYYTSVDNEGNFKVGDSFFVNQKTGDVLFNNQSLSITAPEGVTFTDGVNTTTILSTNIDTGNIRISGNTIESIIGNLNVVSANGIINLQNNTFVSGNLDVSGNITLGGNIQIGDQSSDTITFVGGISSDLVPSVTDTYNLGSINPDTLKWKNVYLNRAEIDQIEVDNNQITTLIPDTDLILSANGTGRIYIPTNNVQIDQNLTVNGTSYINELSVTNTITSDSFTTGNILISDNTITTTITDNNLILSANGAGQIYIPTNDVQLDQKLTVLGLTTLGNVNIGNETTPATITQVGGITQTGDVYQTGEYHLTGNLIVDGIIAQFEDIKLDSNTLTTTQTNSNLIIIANGTGVVSIPNNDVQIDQNLTVTQDFTVTTGTAYLKNVNITGTITQTGDISQTGTFTTSGTTEVTGNITGTGYLQLPDIKISTNTIETTTLNTDLVIQANGTGNVVFEGIKFNNNIIESTGINADVIIAPQGTGSVVINSNQSLIIPVGTTAERPATPTNGMVRYNTDTSRYEARAGSYWIKLGGVEDVSGNTRILAEASPGANDNILYFYANNNLTVTIDSTKLFAERLQTSKLDIYDNVITTILPNDNINLLTTGTGGVNVGNFNIKNNTILNAVSGAITNFIQTNLGYVKIAGTNGFVIPYGDTINRPAFKETGMMRFNTELSLVEIWTGLVWTSVAGTNSGITATEATDIGIQNVLMLG